MTARRWPPAAWRIAWCAPPARTWVQVLAAEPDRPQRCDCHVCVCERLLSRARALTDWEIAFCAKVLRYERAPSAKQAAVLNKLSRRLGFDTS